MNKKFNLTNLALVAILFSTSFFYLGIIYQKTKTPAAGANRDVIREAMGRGDFSGQGVVGGRVIRGGQVIGKIIKINDNKLTVELNNGGSSIVYITDETFIGRMENINKDRLEEGQEVLIFGNSQENQNIIADSVQIR